MKKLLCALLALYMLTSLVFPVFAEEESNATEISISDLILPVANTSIPKDPMEGVKVKVLCSAKDTTAPQELQPIATGFWSESDAKDHKAPATGKFVAGRSYRITITLEFQEEAPRIHSIDTALFINGTPLKLDGKEAGSASEGAKISVYTDYVATPGKFTPKVSLELSGNAIKSYDGKGTTIEAKVETIEGIHYSYAWYHNETLLENETGERITLVHVSDSGEYYCKVTAKSLDKDAQTQSTTSTITQISITPCVVNIVIRDAEKNVFEDDPEFVFDILGEEPYDIQKLTGKPMRKEGEEVGKYTIGIGDLAFPEEIAKNYEIKVTEGTLTIVKEGELAYTPVSSVGDLVNITGKNGSKVLVSVTRGAIPEDAILSLILPEDNVKSNLEKKFSKKVMKAFSVKLQNAQDKELALHKEAKLRIQIPLTEEEEKTFKPETILSALYTKDGKKLNTKIVKISQVTYVEIEIDTLGTVALFEGEKLTATSPEKEEKKEKEEEKGASVWLWILIIMVSLVAIGAIVFTVIITRKKKMSCPTKTYVPPQKTPQTTSTEEKKPKQSSAEDSKAKTRIIPFEDLE